MNNDYQGDAQDFAMVIPVPTVLVREQIHVTDRAIIDHLDAFSAPRLVEYFDEDPCEMRLHREMLAMEDSAAPMASSKLRKNSLGVTVEAEYVVGEYDIVLLSAQQSDGLLTWLNQNGYHVPDAAKQVVNSYLRQGLKFFVAKVNLEAQAKLGFNYLRPLQIAYESPRFMLPIRLGMVNADGPQELFVYALTKNGRVETRNYRTVKLPSNVEIPRYVKSEFGDFYQAMFAYQSERENNRAVFLEYAWDMNWCDPCAADPLSSRELRELGVFWLDKANRGAPAQNVFLTRLHVRYDAANFPEDLMFVQTGDRTNFQGRYVTREPWRGNSRCAAADEYRNKTLPDRQRRESHTLANLTGWDVSAILQRQNLPASPTGDPWWERLWDEVTEGQQPLAPYLTQRSMVRAP